jgi:WD40 repeat protein
LPAFFNFRESFFERKTYIFTPNFFFPPQSGNDPSVLVWDLAAECIVAQFNGAHKFGIEIVKFSPDGRFLVSVGTEHDQSLTVWDLASANKLPNNANAAIARSAISGKILSLAFANDTSFFVTSGVKHLKFWSMMNVVNAAAKSASPTFDGVISAASEDSGAAPATPSTKQSIEDPISDNSGKESSKLIALEGRSAIARAYRDVTFTDVVVSPTNPSITYVVTDNGHLVSFNSSSRVVDKFVEVKSPRVSSVSLLDGLEYIACGCQNGVVRLFHPTTLEYVGSMPRPNAIGKEVKLRSSPSSASEEDEKRSLVFPDTLVCKLSTSDGQDRLVCLYDNKSIFVWDITNINKVGKYRSFLAHSGCVWSIDAVQNAASAKAKFPVGTFVTASADSTIRFWNFESYNSNENIYSRELLDCVNLAADESQTSQLSGFRVVRVSPDGRQIASGDRSGVLRVHEIDSASGMAPRLIMQEDAHDDEILSVSFAQQQDGSLLLASGSRDRCIHLFGSLTTDDTVVYTLRTSLEDHSSSVTALAFSSASNDSSQIYMASAGSDKALMMRRAANSDDISQNLSRSKRAAAQGAIYDVAFDMTNNYVLSVGQEKRIAIYEAGSGKMVRALKLDSDAGAQLDVELDPSGQFVATVGQDRVVRLFNLQSGELVATRPSGHAELTTGCKFSHDGSRLITIGGDGCIFVWRLVDEVSNQIKSRIAALTKKAPSAPAVLKNSTKDNQATKVVNIAVEKDMKSQTAVAPKRISSLFDSKALPSWARSAVRQQQIPGAAIWSHDESSEEPYDHVLQGKWAQRASEGYKVSGIDVKLDSSAPSLRSILSSRRNSTSPAEEPALFFQTAQQKPVAVAKADDLEDDFVDPAQLENMWTAFKEEPLDRLMKPGTFDSLLGDGGKPKPSNPNRLSLSSRFRNNHKAASTVATEISASTEPSKDETSPKSSENSPPLVAAPAANQTAAPGPKDRKQLIAEEVERTRKRLMEMGMLSGGKKSQKTVEESKPSIQVAQPPQVVPEPAQTIENASEVKSIPEEVVPEPQPDPIVDEATSLVIETILDQDEIEVETPKAEEEEDASEQSLDEQTVGGDGYEDDGSNAAPSPGAGETQEFLNNLSHAFDRTVDLYLELKNNGREDEVVGQIANFFNDVSQKLDRVLGTKQSSQNIMLEKYSDLLMAMVSEKLKSK